MIRYGRLNAVVQMRSNDVVFGYRNDYAWQKHVLQKLAKDLGVVEGDIYWNAGSLHVYERHFNMVM
jgi:thymidylate synthase